MFGGEGREMSKFNLINVMGGVLSTSTKIFSRSYPLVTEVTMRTHLRNYGMEKLGLTD